jgi:excinuclease ABC subunit C
LHISKKSPSLLLIQRIRDEAHRFAITFHRQKRSKSTFQTDLDAVKGIGKKTADVLLQRYKSWRKIQQAPLEELEQLVGKAKAQLVKATNEKGT